ncbi:zinc finger protein 836-like [Hyposmocoma kahamanoa]|uniref:zinc finger protein 836-like n=1 Tax=Hyposmocoma kahamanoa TaxID=1477025 RepID=UPI000E6D87EC|nr:zinc finger protein 836-like [Hyposmocoma kahamanoa]
MSVPDVVNQEANIPQTTLASEVLFVQIQLEPEGLPNTEGHEVYDLYVGPGVLLPPDDVREPDESQSVQVELHQVPVDDGTKQDTMELLQQPETLSNVQLTSKETEQDLMVANEYIKQDIANTALLSTTGRLPMPNLELSNTSSPNTFLSDLNSTSPFDFYHVLGTPSEGPSYTGSSGSWDPYEDIIVDMDSVYNACLQAGTSQQLQELTTKSEDSEKTNIETNIHENNIKTKYSELTNVKTNKISEEKQFYEICNKDLQINEYLVIYTQDGTLNNEQFKEIEPTNTPKYNKPYIKYKKVKEEERHICETCNKEFRRKYSLKEHLLTHNVNRPYVCNVCDKGFVRKDHLTRHSKIHKRNKYVCECNVCTIPANHKASTTEKCSSANLHQGHEINQDLTTAGPNVEQQSVDVAHTCDLAQPTEQPEINGNNNIDESCQRKFTCEFCNKELSSLRYLHEHLLNHTGRPFICHICNKSYITKGHLSRHLEIHDSNRSKTKKISSKQYNCELCDKQFRKKHSFNEHQFIHTGEKPFACNICNTCYSRRGSLNRHMKTHRYNQFKCDICNKDYSTERALKRHLLTTHTKLKEFICDTYKDLLEQHLLIHSEEKEVEKPCAVQNYLTLQTYVQQWTPFG